MEITGIRCNMTKAEFEAVMSGAENFELISVSDFWASFKDDILLNVKIEAMGGVRAFATCWFEGKELYWVHFGNLPEIINAIIQTRGA